MGSTAALAPAPRQARFFTDALGGRRHLVIVERGHDDVYRHLVDAFKGVRGVYVLTDRRSAPASVPPAGRERRRRERPKRFDCFGVLITRALPLGPEIGAVGFEPPLERAHVDPSGRDA